MFLTKFVLPALLGVGSIATVSGIVYSNKQEVAKKTNNLSEKEHYVIGFSTIQLEDPQSVVLEDYSCQALDDENKKIENKKDDNCKAYSIDFDVFKRTIKAQDLITNKVATPATNKNEFAYGNFFLLKVATSLYDNWKLDGSENIQLSSKSNAENKYATFGIYGKINKNELIGKYNWIVVKNIESVDALSTFSGSTGYKCEIEDSEVAKKDCAMRSIEQPIENEFNFSSFDTSFSQQQTSITTDHYYIIDLSEPLLKTKDLKEKTIIFTENNFHNEETPNKPKIAKFKVIHPIWGSLSGEKKSVILA